MSSRAWGGLRGPAGTAIVALVARLAVVAWAANRFPPADDGVLYDALARRVADGLGYTWAWPDGVVTPVAHYPVGYPGILALAYWFGGPHPLPVLLLQACIGAVGAASVHYVATEGASPRVARLAGLAAALHPALLSYLPAIMTEGVTAALLATPFAAAVVARRAAGSGLAKVAIVASGLLLGGVALLRPQVLILLPALAWVAAPRPAGLTQRMVTFGIALGGIAAVVGPWTVRNLRAFDQPVLVSANGGWNLWIGTDADAHGGWRALEAPLECREVWGEAAKDACFAEAAEHRITASPLAWLALAPAKLAATFDFGGSGPSYLSRARPDLVTRAGVLAVGGAETLVERLCLGVALLGVAFERGSRRRGRMAIAVPAALCLLTRHAWPAYVGLPLVLALQGRSKLEAEPLRLVAAAVVLSTAVVHSVFFGAARYAMLAYPWVAALACATGLGPGLNIGSFARHKG